MLLLRVNNCYFFASIIIYYSKPRGAFFVSVGLLLLYWLLCVVGNPSDPYSLEGWFGNAVDKSVLGEAHMYRGEGVPFEPEGIMSTMPSIVQVVFGYLVGYFLVTQGKKSPSPSTGGVQNSNPIYKTLTMLFVSAALLLFIGYAWGLVFPINKKIWTSSYVAYTSGLAIIILSLLVYFIEVKNVRGAWSRFFDVFGKNPLFIYALSGLIPRALGLIRIPNGVNDNGEPAFTSPFGWFYQNVAAKMPGPPEFGSLFYALCLVLLLWAIGYWMDKRKLYLRV
jgi:predicted acyltransferase